MRCCRGWCASRKRTRDLPDTWTLELVAADGAPLPRYEPGQFTMLYVFGVGEIPVSISGDAADGSRLVQTIRAVGKVSEALGRLTAGDTLGLRGPFGTAWPVADGYGRDVVVVAGGLGLAPLRPALYQLQAERKRFGKLVLLYGTRRPEDILFRRQLANWRRQLDMEIEVTVDHAGHRLARPCRCGDQADPAPRRGCRQHRGAGLRTGSDDAVRRQRAARYRRARRMRSICRWSAT